MPRMPGLTLPVDVLVQIVRDPDGFTAECERWVTVKEEAEAALAALQEKLNEEEADTGQSK